MPMDRGHKADTVGATRNAQRRIRKFPSAEPTGIEVVQEARISLRLTKVEPSTSRWIRRAMRHQIVSGIPRIRRGGMTRQMLNSVRIRRIAPIEGCSLTNEWELHSNPRAPVWIVGSYGDGAGSSDQQSYSARVARRLGAELARANATAVVGESDLLRDLCDAYRAASSPHTDGRAVMIHGSLRHNPGRLFGSLLRHPPTSLIAVGGAYGGRTARETLMGGEMGLRIGSFALSGGAASRVTTGTQFTETDPSDAVDACMRWLLGDTRSGDQSRDR